MRSPQTTEIPDQYSARLLGLAARVPARVVRPDSLQQQRAQAQGAASTQWRLALARPDAPKVIARLPFVERPDHPAGMPILVIAKPLADGAARDVVLEAVTVDRWRG